MIELKNYSLYFVGIALLLFIIPLPLPLNITSGGLILLFSLIMYFNVKSIRLASILPLAFLFIAFFFLDIINSNNLFYATLNLKEVKLSYLFVPTLLFIIRKKIQKVVDDLFVFFVLGVITYAIYAWLFFLYHLFMGFFDLEINQISIRHFLHYNLKGVYHHAYTGAYFALALFVLANNNFCKMKVINYSLFIFLFITNLYLGSKLSILYTLFIPFFLIFKSKNTLLAGVLFLGFLTLSYYFIYDWFSYDIVNRHGDRIAFWKTSISIIKDNFFRGIGWSNIEHNFVYIEGKKMVLKPHNYFFYEILSNGIFGFFIFISIICFMLKRAILYKNDTYLYFLIIVLISCMFDDFLTTQRGVFYFVFVGMLLHIKKTDFVK